LQLAGSVASIRTYGVFFYGRLSAQDYFEVSRFLNSLIFLRFFSRAAARLKDPMKEKRQEKTL
jgi:hypothetical protein